MRIGELENEVKELSKAAHSRLQVMSEMEKELKRLRNTNKNLNDSAGSKLQREFDDLKNVSLFKQMINPIQ